VLARATKGHALSNEIMAAARENILRGIRSQAIGSSIRLMFAIWALGSKRNESKTVDVATWLTLGSGGWAEFIEATEYSCAPTADFPLLSLDTAI